MRAPAPNQVVLWTTCLLLLTAASLHADQVQMQNGDHYSGKILSMTSNSIVLESDVLGKITLPREKVSSLTMGTSTATNAAPGVPNFTAPAPRTAKVSPTNSDVTAALRRMGANTNFIEQVRQQMLTGANPAANQKYDEMVSGLMTGKLNANDIRNEAKKGIEQIHQLKAELGPQADVALDSYLSILESFVNETEPQTAPTQPAPVPAAPAHFGTNSPTSSVAK